MPQKIREKRLLLLFRKLCKKEKRDIVNFALHLAGIGVKTDTENTFNNQKGKS